MFGKGLAGLVLGAGAVLGADSFEPNNTAAQARPLAFDTVIQVSVHPTNDVDYFVLDVPAPGAGLLDITLRQVPLKLAPKLTLLESTNELASVQQSAGCPLFLRQEVRGAGRYLLQMDAEAYGWYYRDNDQASPELMDLAVHYQPVSLAYETNNDSETAAEIPLGREIVAGFYPTWDNDYYKFSIPGEGGGLLQVAVSNGPFVKAAFSLRDPEQSWVGDQQAVLPGDPLRFQKILATGGVYTIDLRNAEYGAGVVAPYSLRLDYWPPEQLTNRYDTYARARPLVLGTPVKDVLDQSGRVNYYRVAIPEPGRGRLLVQMTEVPDPIAPQLALFDAASNELERVTRRRGVNLYYQRDLEQAGAYVFYIRDGYARESQSSDGEEDYARQPYTLRADFVPAKDPGEPNNAYDTARVVQPGEKIEATIFPQGDQDFFKVAIPTNRQGILQIRLAGMPDHLQPYLRVDDVSRQRVGDLEKSAERNQPNILTRQLGQGGEYFVQVRGRDGWNDSVSLQPYQFMITFNPLTADTREPNNALEAAAPIEAGKPSGGLMFPAGDEDWYTFTLTEKQVGTLRIEAGPFHEAMHPMLELYGADKQLLRRWQTRAAPHLLYETPLDKPGAYYLRLLCQHHRAGPDISTAEQFDLRPYTLQYSIIPTNAPAAAASEKEDNATFLSATPLAAGAIARGLMTNRWDWDIFRLRVDAPAEVTAQLWEVPGELDLRCRAFFLPDQAGTLAPFKALYIHGPRGDFALADRYPDISFDRVEENTPDAKTLFANPEVLAKYRAIIIEALHNPEALDLANPRVQENLARFMQNGGRVLVVTPFCDLPFFNVKVEQINSWHKDQVVDLRVNHPLLAGQGTGHVRGWNVYENIGCLGDWQKGGFQMLFAHASNPTGAAVTVARAVGKGWLVIDTQTPGHPNAYPAADWKIRSFLGLPAVQVLGEFNNTALFDGARWEGQPESFSFKVEAPGTCFLAIAEREGRATANAATYALRASAAPLVVPRTKGTSYWDAVELALNSTGTPVTLDKPYDQAWFRWKGQPPGTVALALEQVPADCDPVMQIYRWPAEAPERARRVLYLHGNHGDFQLDRSCADITFERIEWNDERADTILQNPAALAGYDAVIVEAMTRANDFGMDREAVCRSVEQYVANGGLFAVFAPLCPMSICGVRNEDAQWRGDNVEETWLAHTLLKGRQRDDRLAGWPGYESIGYWVLPPGQGWQTLLQGWYGARQQPVLAVRGSGKGYWVLSTQPAGTSANLAAARWQLYAFLGITNRLEKIAEVDHSAGISAGGDEFYNCQMGAGTYYLRVYNRYATRPQRPLLVKTAVTTVDRALEPDDSPAAAQLLAPGTEASATLYPAGDEDWRKVQLYESGRLQVQVANVADNLDPVLRIQKAAPGGPALKVLYLEADPYAAIDESRYEGVHITRIHATDYNATNALSRLDDYQLLIIASLDHATQFGLNQKSAHERIRAFAERGGRVLVVAPRGVSFAENTPAMGGRLESWSSEWDGGYWKALNLTDGYALPNQGGRGWCCGRGATFPHDITWSFGGEARVLDRLVLYNHTGSPGARARMLELQAGNDTNLLRKIGAFTAADNDERQEFAFPAVTCRYVRLVISTNYGHAGETQMGEVLFFGPHSIPGFWGLHGSGGEPANTLVCVDPAHWIASRRAQGEVNYWPDARNSGWWVEPAGTNFHFVYAERSDPAGKAFTALRAIGQGWIVVDAQRLTRRENQAAAAWKWHNYFDTPLAVVGDYDRTQDMQAGGPETVSLALSEEATLLARVSEQTAQDGYTNQSPHAYIFGTRFQAAAAANEPNNLWTVATPLAVATPMQDSLFPAGDSDWFRFTLERPADVVVRLEEVPSVLDPEVEVFRCDPFLKPVRVLYLTCRADAAIDRWQYGPVPLSFTRIMAGTPAEATAWEGLAGANVTILEGLDDIRRFGMDRPETYQRIQRYVEQGGTFVLLAPGSYSCSALGKESGAKLVSFSDSWNQDSWHPKNLGDGYWEQYNGRGGWCSGNGAPFPHEFVFKTGGATPPSLDRLVLYNCAQDTNSPIGVLEVQFAERNESNAFKTAGRFVCSNTFARQAFALPAAQPRFIKLIAHTNFGHARETQCGEIEFFGPGRQEAPFGVQHFRGLLNDSQVSCLDTQHWIATRKADSQYDSWRAGRRYGYFTGWRAQGFEMVFSDKAGTNECAVTLCKKMGQGWLVLDTQDLGYGENQRYTEWKLLNYFRLPVTRVGRFNQTVSGNARGGAEIFRFGAAPGQYYARIFDEHPGAESVDKYSLAINAWPTRLAFEPDNSPREARPLLANVIYRTTLFPDNDADWFKVDLATNTPLIFETRAIPENMDLQVQIYQGTNWTYSYTYFNSGNLGVPEMGRFDPRTNGTHYVQLSDATQGRRPCRESVEFVARHAGQAAAEPLRVLSVAPAPGSVEVGSNTQMEVAFNTPLAADAAQPGAITVQGSLSGRIHGQVQADPPAGMLYFVPEQCFKAGETVQVKVARGVKDAVGNVLAGDYDWAFVIRPEQSRLQECAFQIELQPAAPLRPGTAQVTVIPSARLRTAPEITIATAAGQALALSAPVKNTEGNYTLTLTVPPGIKRQTAAFTCAATDALGRRARKIAQGEYFEVDGEPPPAVAGVGARAGRNGKALVEWQRPTGVDDLGGYEVYRAAQSVARREEATLVKTLAGADVLTCEDDPPRDGTWYYAVAAMDKAGNRGPLSPMAHVPTDRVAPKATVGGVSAKVVRKPGIEVAWGAGTGDAFAGYSIFRNRAGEPAPSAVASLAWTETARDKLSAQDFPGDGSYRYYVGVRDEAGNVGPLSSPAAVVLDTRRAWANFQLSQPAPLGAGTVQANIYLSEPVAEGLKVLARLPNGEARPLPVRMVAPTNYVATLVITTNDSDGWARFELEGRDLYGNEGVDLYGGYSFSIDTRPPLAWVSLQRGGFLGSGTNVVTVDFSEDVQDQPVLKYGVAGRTNSITLRREKDRRFTGNLVLDRATPNGPVQFAVEAVDSFGHRGGQVERGQNAIIDSLPPDAPLSVLVEPGPERSLLVSWMAATREPIAFYRVYGFTGTATGVCLADQVRDLRAAIKPAITGAVQIAVAAVDRAGNESPLSERANGVFDFTPPPPPAAVAAALLRDGRVRVEWKAPAVTETVSYQVYRAEQPPAQTTNRVKLATTKELFILDEPRTSALLYYAVSALDKADNESPLAAAPPLDYDTAPPRAKITLAPVAAMRPYSESWYVHYDIPILTAGMKTVVLETSEPLREKPRLRYRSRSQEVPAEIALAGQGARWTGALGISNRLDDGLLTFLFEGTDAKGNRGEEIMRGQGNVAWVDTLPPLPVSTLSATSRPLGKIECAWAPPPGESTDQITYSVYRATQLFTTTAALAPVATNLREPRFTDSPPLDGVYYYGVIATDWAGQAGRLFTSVVARSDGKPPSAPANLRAEVPGEVLLTWTNRELETLNWQVFRDGLMIADARAENFYKDLPEKDGTYSYKVVAVDAAGNSSVASAPVTVEFTSTLPAAVIRTEPASPVKSTFRVLLSCTEPLREAPDLFIHFAWGTPLRVDLEARDALGKEWAGSVAVNQDTPQGPSTFTFNGVSKDGKKGARVRSGAQVVVDTTPPAARIRLQPPSPLHSGKVRVWLEPNEPLADTPKLLATLVGVAPRELALTPTGGVFAADLEITDADQDGIGTFSFTGLDLAGNAGSRLENHSFVVDHHVPKPPSQLKAAAQKGGYVELSWVPPVYAANEVSDQLAGYNLYAATTPITAVTGLTPMARNVARIPHSLPVGGDGKWFFAATTVDTSGLESKPTENASVVADRTPPAAPVISTTTVSEAAIEIKWEKVEDAATYAVLVQPPAAEQFSMVTSGVGGCSFVYRPLDGGRYAFRVTAMDALGHESAPGIPAVVYFEQLAPLAGIRLPASLLGAGAHELVMATTRPLVSAPKLVFTDAAGKAQAIAMRGMEKQWLGVLTVATNLAEGAGRFAYEGTTREQGRTSVGSGILTGATVILDFTPPTGAIELQNAPAKREEKLMLKAGKYPLTLRMSEPLRDAPQLQFTPRGAEAETLLLTQISPTEWTGLILVDTGTPNGTAVFELAATDRQGNQGDAITQNRVVEIDVQPPARIAQLRAAPLPGGKCRVEWTAPVGPDGRADAGANRFHLYRSESEILDATGMEVFRVIDRTLGYLDTPPADRTYYYAVAAVDEGGNQGSVSICAKAAIDKTAPQPATDLRATQMSNGVVHLAWSTPPGEKPLFYNVYLADHPILSTAGLAPMNYGVTWNEIYGTPNYDGKYYFAVTSVDGALNESAPSDSVLLDYKAIPPIARFYLEPDIWLKDGAYPVRLEITKDLVEPPVVEINSESGQRYPLTFAGGGREWRATLVMDAAYPEGTYGFIFRGKDEAGNVGDEIARGPLFHVDRAPPLAPSDLKIVPDSRGTPGAVSLSWRTPKLEKETTEVPGYGFHIYRSTGTIASIKGMKPVQTVRLKYANLDEFSCMDMPPANGSFHYVVTSLDLARNESAPSPETTVTVHSDAPRVSISLYRVEGTALVPAALNDQGLPILGRGKARLRLVSAVPLKAPPVVSWRLKFGDERARPVAMRGLGTDWWGDFEIIDKYDVEQPALFAFSGTSMSGLQGTYINQGEGFVIDTTGPVADIIIPSVFKMLVHVKNRALQTPPVSAGLQEVKLVAPDELAAPPQVFYTLGSGERIAIPMQGFGRYWNGYMEIPVAAHAVTGRFYYVGTDRAGNVSTNIAKVRYEHEDDGEFPTPRRTASYATTGGSFTTDTQPPAAPAGVETEMRKLGVAVIKWQEPAGEPNSYNLYRALTPITRIGPLQPIKKEIYATIIVDDPPVDGNYFYAVSASDFSGNESELSECKNVFIDTIKPELKIKAMPSGDDFEILLDEDAPAELSLTLRFPGQRDIQVELGGSSGELEKYKVITMPNGERRVVLPQMVGFFNGRVEVIVHSPDPEGNLVEEKTELEMRQISAATGGEVSSVDEQVQLIIPPGLQPVIPEGPGKSKRVGGYDNLFFIKYANIPKEKPVLAEGEARTRDQVDPLPPGLEIVGVPYVIEMNQPPEEPLQLKGSASQADFSQLKPLMAKLKMKVPEQYSDAVEDPEYLKTRLKVMQWVPTPAEQAPGHWEALPDIELDPATKEFIVPASNITTYVIVSEHTPPAVRDLRPGRDEVINEFQPEISCLLVDKGTGIAGGAENRVVLTLDGRKIPENLLEISKGDPTEVRVTYRPREKLTAGRHTVGIRAEDVVENVADVKWQFLIDNKPPLIYEVRPREKERLPIGRPLIQVIARDEGGINPAASMISVDGESIPASSISYDADEGLLLAFLPWTLSSGEHEARVEVVDHAGLAAALAWNFRIDLEPPAISNLWPAAGSRVAPSNTTIAFSLGDVLGLPQVLDFRLNGYKIPFEKWRMDKGFTFDSTKGAGVFMADQLPPGEHEITLLFSDDLGNTARQSWQFKSDVKAGLGAVQAEAWRPQFISMGTTAAVKSVIAKPLAPPAAVATTQPSKVVQPPVLREDDLKALQAARKARAEGGYLEAKGDLAGALAQYEKCLALMPDPALQKKVAVLKAQQTPPVVLPKTPAPSEPAVQPDPQTMNAVRRARADASYYEMKGDYQKAIEAYQKSQALWRDPALEPVIEKLQQKIK